MVDVEPRRWLLVVGTVLRAVVLISGARKLNAQCVSEFARGRLGQSYFQAIFGLTKLNLRTRSNQFDIGDLKSFGLTCRAKSMNHSVAIGKPGHLDRVERGPFLRETEILRRVWLGVHIVSEAGQNFCWSFAIDFPRGRVVDCLAILLQPSANTEQGVPHFIGNRTIRTRPDIQ